MKNIERVRKIIHDINSPLTSVIGYSELLQRKNLGEKESEWVKKLHDDSLRIKDLLKELSEELSDTVSEPPDRVD